jgi:hypothetical protein
VVEKLVVGEGEAVAPAILRAALMAPPHIPSCCRLYYVAAWCVDEFKNNITAAKGVERNKAYWEMP